MSETSSTLAQDRATKPIHVSRSFTRMESAAPPLSPRKRANTMQETSIHAVPEARQFEVSRELDGKPHAADVFENGEDESEGAQPGAETSTPEIQLPSTFDELPIEIRSLTERFLERLSAKVHPQPLSADALSELFQDFYERSASHIATHIASLSSRIGREKSPTPSTDSKSALKGRARAGSGAKRLESLTSGTGGEMLTASEVAERKRARRLLELKKVALEEAVERAVTEKVYERIWKHRSTDDDARDEKLRSRTAALSLVGIGFKELHMDSDPRKEDVRKATQEKEHEIHQSLATAREALQQMDEEHYPLGKLKHLTDAHKSIVETLSQLFPSSSSADEILPTLIYTLITSPPEGINVVSNLNFIQRFRASNKVDGEAAYCLVNLEAAISFVETVDLSSLRADELPEGPPKSSSQPSTPTIEVTSLDLNKVTPVQTIKAGVSPVSAYSSDISTGSNEAAKILPSPRTPTITSRPSMHQRRLSALMQAQADRIEASRDNFLNTADKIYDSINGTLDNSLQFVFGRFKDRTSGASPLPKTLEDARKLVSSPPAGEDEDILSNSGRSSPLPDDPLNSSSKPDAKVLELISGRKQMRDRSADSTRGNNANKRPVFSPEAPSKDKPKDEPAVSPAAIFANINPLNRFNVPSFARFGRASSGGSSGVAASSPAAPVSSLSSDKSAKLSDIVESPSATDENEIQRVSEKDHGSDGNVVPGIEDLNARETLAELRRIKPPKKRFLDVQNAGELRIGEVEELLLEYRRLAKAIGEAVAM